MGFDAPMMERTVHAMASPVGAAPEPVIETVRTFFPETWIWELVDVG